MRANTAAVFTQTFLEFSDRRRAECGRRQPCALTAIDIYDSLIVSEVGRCRGDRLLRNALGRCLVFEVG
jgi:hypothetical protein